MSIKRFSIFLGLLVANFLLASGVFAATSLPTPVSIGLPFESSDVASSVGKIIKQAIMFAGVLAVMALTYGGLLMMLSYGDDGKVK